jgi:hypothetical protein
MVDPIDSWPRYPTGPEDHLKALGVISLNFNLYEFSLVIFLERHLNKEAANLLFGRLNNVDLAPGALPVQTTRLPFPPHSDFEPRADRDPPSEMSVVG